MRGTEGTQRRVAEGFCHPFYFVQSLDTIFPIPLTEYARKLWPGLCNSYEWGTTMGKVPTTILILLLSLAARPSYAEHGNSMGGSSGGSGGVNNMLSGRGAGPSGGGGGGGGGGSKAREAAEYGMKTLMPKVLEDNNKKLDEFYKNTKASTDSFNANADKINKINDNEDTAKNMKQITEITNSFNTAGIDKASEETFKNIVKTYDEMAAIQNQTAKTIRDAFISAAQPAPPAAPQGPTRMQQLQTATNTGSSGAFSDVLAARSDKADRIPKLRNGAVDPLSNGSGQHGVAPEIRSLQLQSTKRSYNPPINQ